MAMRVWYDSGHGKRMGMDDVHAPLIEDLTRRRGVVLLLGAADTGKTTFARQLLGAAIAAGKRAAFQSVIRFGKSAHLNESGIQIDKAGRLIAARSGLADPISGRGSLNQRRAGVRPV